MNILLTGGTGFIGSYVLRQLIERGDNVILSTTRPLKPLLGYMPKRVIVGSLLELDSAKLGSIDSIIHLAATGVSPRQASWNQLQEVNIKSTLHICQIAKSLNASIVIAGTYAEYGLSGLKFDEIPPNAPLEPAFPYATSKAAAGQLALGFARSEGIKMAYLRIFNAFGPGQHSSNLWPSLINAAASGKDFEMTPGEQIRDFIKASCVASQFIDACRSSALIKGSPLVVNVGSGCPQTVRQFCEYWWAKESQGGRLLIGAKPYRANEIMRYVPSLTPIYT